MARKCGIGGDAQVAKRARDSSALPDDALALEPLELDLGAARARTARDERRSS